MYQSGYPKVLGRVAPPGSGRGARRPEGPPRALIGSLATAPDPIPCVSEEPLPRGVGVEPGAHARRPEREAGASAAGDPGQHAGTLMREAEVVDRLREGLDAEEVPGVRSRSQRGGRRGGHL